MTVAQLRAFIGLLPEWDELAIGLDAIVLDDGDQDCMGWSTEGVVAICAWERNLWWTDAIASFVTEHQTILDLLDVDHATVNGKIVVRWTEDQARAFQLLHILTHELGHHHDRITNRSRTRIARGEPYAETYAHRALDNLWPAYTATFTI